jgi:integrase/recombinase XerD
VTHLRNMVLEELQRRNYSQNTTKIYIRTIWEFAKYFHRPPEELGPEQIRQFQAHLFSVRKLAANSVAQRTAALRHYAEFRTMPSKLSAPCVFGFFPRQDSA